MNWNGRSVRHVQGGLLRKERMSAFSVAVDEVFEDSEARDRSGVCGQRFGKNGGDGNDWSKEVVDRVSLFWWM